MSFIRRIPLNAAGRDILVGDIHGHFERLERGLSEIKFDQKVDRLFSVGDLVDRGPDSDQSILWLDRPWFHAVMGNHEMMAIQWTLGDANPIAYAHNGGSWLMGLPSHEADEYAMAFSVLPIAIELETTAGPIGLVHADVPPGSWQDLAARLDANDHAFCMDCIWSRLRFDTWQATGHARPVDGIRAVVVGHTPVKSPTWIENVLNIDTGSCFGGPVTLIDAATLEPIWVEQLQ